ncbi:MAG TPA: TIGR01212 family radical SAM protein [Clostridiaceae bacterium]|nr:TIGR01212 family radical SAM protein [Clostridiaceae bacterium]
MKIWPDQKPYYSANQYYRQIFGDKVYKISLDIGCTCPTRDGTKGIGGCTFCSARGSGDFAIAGPMDIREKINSAIQMVASKIRTNKYIAYLQSFSNTYGPVKLLVPVYEEILSDERVVGLSIGTRPDCLSDAMIKELGRLSKIKPLWIELGLQTIHQKTADLFHRGYDLPVYENAVARLNKFNIPVIVHLIVGLMGETYDDFMATIDYMANQLVSGIKLSMLHILKDSLLYKEYLEKPFPLLDEETYIEWVAEAITRMPEEMVIHRVTGDGNRKNLVAPEWSANKRHVLNGLLHYMAEHGMFQGLNYKKPARVKHSSRTAL